MPMRRQNLIIKFENEVYLEEIKTVMQRCLMLENALFDFIEEAHYKCLSELNECDHSNGLCYCSYNKALKRAEKLLKKRIANNTNFSESKI